MWHVDGEEDTNEEVVGEDEVKDEDDEWDEETPSDDVEEA